MIQGDGISYESMQEIYDTMIENLLTCYFFFEIMIRFFTFQGKLSALWDKRFVFDAILCSMMVLEVRVMSLIALLFAQTGDLISGNTSILRSFRMMKLLRCARMGRLLREPPELMVLVRGMSKAMRGLMVTSP